MKKTDETVKAHRGEMCAQALGGRRNAAGWLRIRLRRTDAAFGVYEIFDPLEKAGLNSNDFTTLRSEAARLPR